MDQEKGLQAAEGGKVKAAVGGKVISAPPPPPPVYSVVILHSTNMGA